MSTRERWIVYPLLFLTLGIALRDKIVPPGRLGGPNTRIEAGELVVRTLHCGEADSGRIVCGAFGVAGQQGRPVVAIGNASGRGVVETFAASGAPLVRLDASDSGGVVTAYGYAGKDVHELFFGHAGRDFGLFAGIPELKQRLQAVFLWQPWNPAAPPAKPQSPNATEAAPPKKIDAAKSPATASPHQAEKPGPEPQNDRPVTPPSPNKNGK